MSNFHTPVLLKEVIKYLNIKRGGRYIDATVGGGGHSSAILKQGGILLALDQDPEALEAARKHLSSACPIPAPHKSGSDAPWRLAQGNFAHLETISREENFFPVDGILFDLGVSSHQLDTPARGFSFNSNGPLDMRMDPNLKVSAADLVNGLNVGELAELFAKLGGEHHARRIAEAVVRYRNRQRIDKTEQLASLIVHLRLPASRYGRIHPATRIFQALRMAVNDELNNLRQALPAAMAVLKSGGRLLVISFHSGEDKIVKNFFRQEVVKNNLVLIMPKLIRPTPTEIKQNPRSHSARLRVAEKK